MNDNLTDEDSYDDRILGGGEFVESVLNHANVPKECCTLDELLRTVADYYGLDVEQLCCPEKHDSLFRQARYLPRGDTTLPDTGN